MEENHKPGIKNPNLSSLESSPEDVGKASGDIYSHMILDTRNKIPTLKSVAGKVEAFASMKTNSTISGILLAFRAICQTTREMVNENPDDPDKERAKQRAKFLESCLKDMQTPFSDVVGEILNMIPMGFQVMVPQFKARTGYDNDPSFNSKNHDGKLGWKNFTPIDPETIEGWNSPEGGGYLKLTGITQRLQYSGNIMTIPRNRLMIFRAGACGNSPIGKSILEGAYKDWVDLEEAGVIQMVGLRRNLIGIPYVLIHSKIAAKAATDPSARAAIQASKDAVRNLDNTKDLAFVGISDRDERGHKLIEVGLMGSQEGGGNTKIQDAKIIIDAKEQTIARSMLAQFMTIQGKGGSYALSKTQSEVFINSLKMYMNQIADIMNLEAIPRLFAANGEGISKDDNYLPTLSFSDFIKEDVEEFFSAIKEAVETGIFEVTPQIQKKAGQVVGVDITGQEEGLSKRKAELEDLKRKAEEEEQNSEGSEPDGLVSDEDVPETKKEDIKDSTLLSIIEDE